MVSNTDEEAAWMGGGQQHSRPGQASAVWNAAQPKLHPTETQNTLAEHTSGGASMVGARRSLPARAGGRAGGRKGGWKEGRVGGPGGEFTHR